MSLAAFLERTNGLSAAERSIETNGIELEVTVLGEGEKLALCLHGFPEHAISWRFQAQMLAELGYQVWVPNMRGYGSSHTVKERAAYTIDHLLADVAGLIDQAGSATPLQEIVLLSHDWGALIGWEFAMRKVRPIDRLVIMNVPHPAIAVRHSRNWYQIKKSWYVLAFQLPWLPEWGLRRNGAASLNAAFQDSVQNKENFTDDVLEIYRANALRPDGATGMINYYRANFGAGKLTGFDGQRPPTIDIPVLMVWGENDIALDVRLTEGTDAYVSDLTLRHLPGISHWVQQDAPETVNTMLRAWLTGAPVPFAGAFPFPLK